METINKNIELLVSKPLSFEKVSSQLTKCRCYVVASGRNVNGSDITLEAIEKAKHTLYNMPLVANLKKKDGGSGWCVGSHDVEVVWNEDDELEINDLTVPFGVVPENCNAQIEEVLEPDGITKNSYLVVDVLLWSGRYNILDAAYSDDTYFNQSCEILVEKAHWDDDGYYVIEDFEFSALCLLGKSNDPKYNKRPCFPSCRVEKMKYSLDEDKFKQQFSLLMQEIKKTESVNSVQKNNKKEDDVNLDKNKKETLFSNVKAKIAQLMSETTYCDASTNKRYEKYKVLNISESDNAIIALDREENYSAYKIPYIVSYQADDSAIVTFDFQAKTAMKVGVTEDTDVVFNIKDEISIVTKDTAEYEIASYSNNHINYLTKQLDNIRESYNTAQTEISDLKKQIATYETEKREFEVKRHKDIIDTLIASSREEMGKYSDFLEYCVKIDYSKTVDAVKEELKDIHYNFMLKNKGKNKTNFSAIESQVADLPAESDPITARWGEMAKFLNK